MPSPPPELARELLWMAVLGIALLLVMAMVFSAVEEWSFALRWSVLAFPCWGFMLWQCRTRLHLNRSTINAGCYSTLGHGNRLTLVRGLLIAATAGFLATPSRVNNAFILYLPALLYTAAALGDWFDGCLARRQQQTTLLGKELDTELDALGLLVAPLLAVLHGKLHLSYLLVSSAYYLFQWGLYWRRQHHRPVYPLPPSTLRRYLAGVQMGLVAAALWPPLPAEITAASGFVFMLPMLLGFWRDWLYVSGRRRADRKPAS